VHEEAVACLATDTDGPDNGSDNVPLVIARARKVALNHVGPCKLASVFTHVRSWSCRSIAPDHCHVVAA
jgi:hypothetical protein